MRWQNRRKVFMAGFLLGVGLLGGTVWAQEPEGEMTLEDMLLTKITVASVKPLTLRESPGIVTLITAEEIKRSGARDLIDVLRLVPGLDFGLDVQSVIGMGVRGNWAAEGKMLLTIDGHEINEPLYSSLQFGNHFPVDQIKKIEIIRGPGSAIYGGFAELAVIKIETKGAAELNGGEVSAVYGQMPKVYGRRNFSAAYGASLAGELALSAAVFWGQGIRSDREYTDYLGSAYSLADNSAVHPTNVNLKLDFGGLKVRFMLDQYRTQSRDEYGESYPEPVSVDFDSWFARAEYAWQALPELKLMPEISFKHQAPWKNVPAAALFENAGRTLEDAAYDTRVMRSTAKLKAAYDPLPEVNVQAGLEYQDDQARDNQDFGYFPDGSSSGRYANSAGYLQGLWNSPWVQVTAGARYDRHSAYGEAFVPRVGLNKVWENWHLKALASQAFRAPSIENINVQTDIQPERTTVYEIEAGYRFSPAMGLTVNLFDVEIDRAIVYEYDDVSGLEYYRNYAPVRTRGAELEYRWKKDWGYLTCSYSFYRVAENNVNLYVVPGREDLLLAFPGHKLTLNGSWVILPRLSFNPSAVWLHERYGYAGLNTDGEEDLRRFEPMWLVNLNLLYEDAVLEGLDLSLAVYNALNSAVDFIQPYNAGHPPLPGSAREVLLKASYRF